MIDVQAVHAAYRDRVVLDDLTLRVGPGLVGLLGVNGAGKTTLLHTIAGLRPPERGRVEVDGIDVHGPRATSARRRIGLVPQEVDLPGRLRVRELLLYLAWVRDVPRDRRRRAVDDVLERVGLGDRAGSSLGSLSGGMRRRVLVAQGLLAEPDVLLLDEPTTGLDPEQRHGLRALVAHVAEGRTVVVSSHLVEDLGSLADRLLVLDRGAVAFDGPVAALRAADPAGADDLESGFLAVLRDGAP